MNSNAASNNSSAQPTYLSYGALLSSPTSVASTSAQVSAVAVAVVKPDAILPAK